MRTRDALWAVVVLAAVAFGVVEAIIAGASSSPHSEYSPPLFLPPPIHIEIPPPPSFDTLALFGPISRTLPHEVHRWGIEHGHLRASGVVQHPSDAESLEDLRLDAQLLDATGRLLDTQVATISCPTITPGESCAWALLGAAPLAFAKFEFVLVGQRRLELWPSFERRARFDAHGRALDAHAELDFEPDAARVRLQLEPEDLVLDGHVTITCRDEFDDVLDVVEFTASDAWSGAVVLELARPSGCSSYEVRASGKTLRSPSAINPS